MSVLDAPMRSLAKTLATTFGKTGTIESVTTGAYDTSTGTASQGTTSVVRSGVVEQYTDAEIDGTTVRRGDFKWSIAAKGIDKPAPNDVVDFGENTPDGKRIRYTVVDVMAHYSGDEAALYVLQLRR